MQFSQQTHLWKRELSEETWGEQQEGKGHDVYQEPGPQAPTTARDLSPGPTLERFGHRINEQVLSAISKNGSLERWVAWAQSVLLMPIPLLRCTAL